MRRSSVSVVIPAYNRPVETIRAVKSVVAQSVEPFEIIVVDDASPIPVDIAALTAIDRRVRVISHSINLGGGAARNTGIEAATGKWLALLDSDDHWLPDKLERQLSQIESTGLGERVVAVTNVMMRTADAADRPYNLAPRPDTTPLSEWFLVDGGTYQTSGILLRTAFAQAVKFDPRLRKHQDWDFLLRLEKAGGEFAYLHECPVIFECGPSQTRVSNSGGYAATLNWFDLDEGLITPRARHIHYIENCFYYHRLADPKAAVRTLCRYAFAYPNGVPNTLKHFFARLRTRLR